MTSATTKKLDRKIEAITIIAGIFLMIQFIAFMYDYNFGGNLMITLTGWLLLILSFLLISYSKVSLNKKDSNGTGNGWMFSSFVMTRFGSVTLFYPFLTGWLLMSAAITMISQNWFSMFCMGIQFPLIIFIIYDHSVSNEKHEG